MPLEFADLSKLDMRLFENYCLIISAVEDNLAEFKQLKENLEQVRREERRRGGEEERRRGGEEERRRGGRRGGEK